MIEIRDLHFFYPSRTGASRPVFAGLNLSVPRGRYVAIMGPNGSGKSTLGRLLKGLLAPASGEVRIAGRPLGPGEISPLVGYIFSNPENQIISSVVEEDVAFGLENMGLPRAVIEKRVQESLEWVGLAGYRFHSPHLLSGGQQQKVVLAGILAMESDLLVLDEPTSMLDLQDRKEVLDLFRRLHDPGGKTLVHITHSLEEAFQAQDLIYLDQGRIAFQGPLRDFLAQEDWIASSRLSLPPLQQLIQGLRALGFPLPWEVSSLAELKPILSRLKSEKEA